MASYASETRGLLIVGDGKYEESERKELEALCVCCFSIPANWERSVLKNTFKAADRLEARPYSHWEEAKPKIR